MFGSGAIAYFNFGSATDIFGSGAIGYFNFGSAADIFESGAIAFSQRQSVNRRNAIALDK